jgi:hypothetical protein
VAGAWPIATNAPSTSIRSAERHWRHQVERDQLLGLASATNCATERFHITLMFGWRTAGPAGSSRRARGRAVDQRHVLAVIGHVERFFDRGIAAADHHHFLAAVEEAVAGRAGADPPALQMLLGRQVQPFGLGSGRDHQRVAFVDVAAVALQPERPLGQVDLDDLVPHHGRADMLGLGLHLLHQPGPWMVSRKPG